jgi:hypothetical protein
VADEYDGSSLDFSVGEEGFVGSKVKIELPKQKSKE